MAGGIEANQEDGKRNSEPPSSNSVNVNGQSQACRNKSKAKHRGKSKGSPVREWPMISTISKKRNKLANYLRDNIFQLLGALSLIIAGILFVFQACLAFRSFQMMNRYHSKPQIPEILYRIYFEGHDWAMDQDHIDMRANTSIYMH